jgi:O-antigen/teichoic acid export membrane protein
VREALKRLTGESVVYGLGQVSGRAVQLLLVPILTRVLEPQAFGMGELIIAYSQTAVLVLVFGMDGALARFFYHEPDRAARIRMASTSLVFRLAFSAIVAIALVLAGGPLGELLLGGGVYRKYLVVGAATLPFTMLVLFANDVLRVTFQPWKFIALNVCQTVLVAGVSLWLVVHERVGVVGVLYGRLAGDALSALVGLVLVRHTIGFHFRRDVLQRMLAYGAPLVPVALAYGAIAGVDRFVLQRTRSLEEVAVYAVAMKFFAVVTMGVSAFQLAYGPFAFARARDPQAPRMFARVFAAFVALGSLGALAVSAFAREALVVLAPESYAPAALPAAFLAFAAVAQGAYYVASVGIGLALRTSLLGYCAAAAAVVAVVSNALLTPRLGAPGAAASTALAMVTSATLTYVVAQRVKRFPYRGARLLALFAVALAIALAVVTRAPGGVAGVAVKLGAIVAFAGLCTSARVWWNDGAVGRMESEGPTDR